LDLCKSIEVGHQLVVGNTDTCWMPQMPKPFTAAMLM